MPSGGSTRAALEEAIEDGDLQADAPVGDIVRLLASITYGQQVYQVTVPETSAAEHLRLVEALLHPWRTAG